MKKNSLIVVLFFVCMSMNAQIFRPLDQMSDAERSYFLAERFWDGFPFHDTMILHDKQRFPSGAIENYLQAISQADLPTIQRSLVETMRRADTNERMWRFFAESFDLYLNSEFHHMRNEQWIEPVWHQMLKSQWTTFADSAKLNFFIRRAAETPVGSIAPDLEFLTIQGQRGRLSEFNAERILIYFYIPGCPQCAMTIEWITRDTAYQELIQAGILKGFAFYPEHNLNVFRQYSSTIPSTWVNAREPDGMSQLEEQLLYRMNGAPTMYLLDRDKTIILKDATLTQLYNEFDRARNRFLR